MTDEAQRRYKIAARMSSTAKLFSTVSAKRKWPIGIYLNLSILENAIEHYFRDVGETKSRHGIDNADRHKRAAFTLKWISRIRPIQVEAGVKISHTEFLLANEIFAVFAALEHLEITFADIDFKWLANMIFTLRYRDFNAETMASEMYLVEQSKIFATTLSSSP